MAPQTHYARSGNINIAYQVIGDGPRDLVFVMGWVSHLDWFWQEPRFARFLNRLASFSRLILFDKRGTGLSDRAVGLPMLEERMDDVRAVMDAVGSERAALLGISEGGAMCALFAATYPERTDSLIMCGGFARRLAAPDYPHGVTIEERQRFSAHAEQKWGGDLGLPERAPSLMHDEPFREWWTTYLRMSASPGAAAALVRMNTAIDVRDVLPAIRVPTLILHRAGDRTIKVELGRYLAERISGARLVVLPGEDHLPFAGNQDALLDEIELFLTGTRPSPAQADRVLATLLFTEIVGAAESALRLDDRQWRDQMNAHDRLVRSILARFRGREIKRTVGGFVAAFDGPARAIRCASEIVGAAGEAGLAVRAGLHTGECEARGGELSGVAVHIAARVLARAGPGDTLVSSTVRDLVAGSGIEFEEISGRLLAGPGSTWRLFRVASPAYAAQESAAPAEPRMADALPVRLSRRERQVAERLAGGLSNREIAEDLSISVATVERHVANTFNKLGYHSRAQVAAWVVEQGLEQVHDGS